jgi:hypothetical protein
MTTILNSEPSDIERLERRVREGAGWETNHLIMQTIIDISLEIPSNVNTLTVSLAEHLAGRFLQGMVLSGDLVAIALQYEFRMELKKKTAFGKAVVVKAPEAGFKRQKDAEQFAYTDTEYIEACERYISAKSFRARVAEKHKAFEKAHHLMRKIAEQRIDKLGSPDVSHIHETNINDDDWSVIVGD